MIRRLICLRRWFLFVIICIGMGSFTGCASLGTYNAATGRREFIMISTVSEVNMGQEVHQTLMGQHELSHDIDKTQRLVDIGQRLAMISDRQDYQYHFYLLEKDELNAFTTPGGNIYFYTGLLEQLTTDAQVASVLAHEIGHCAARHTIKKFQAAIGYDFIERLVFSQLEMGDGVRRLAKFSAGSIMKVVSSAYSRQDELEADRLGVKYMVLAGYDPQGVIQALTILKEHEEGGAQSLGFLRSHPYLEDRIQFVQEQIKKVTQQYGSD